jgi:hypothetical protein
MDTPKMGHGAMGFGPIGTLHGGPASYAHSRRDTGSWTSPPVGDAEPLDFDQAFSAAVIELKSTNPSHDMNVALRVVELTAGREALVDVQLKLSAMAPSAPSPERAIFLRGGDLDPSLTPAQRRQLHGARMAAEKRRNPAPGTCDEWAAHLKGSTSR